MKNFIFDVGIAVAAGIVAAVTVVDVEISTKRLYERVLHIDKTRILVGRAPWICQFR